MEWGQQRDNNSINKLIKSIKETETEAAKFEEWVK